MQMRSSRVFLSLSLARLILLSFSRKSSGSQTPEETRPRAKNTSLQSLLLNLLINKSVSSMTMFIRLRRRYATCLFFVFQSYVSSGEVKKARLEEQKLSTCSARDAGFRRVINYRVAANSREVLSEEKGGGKFSAGSSLVTRNSRCRKTEKSALVHQPFVRPSRFFSD